MKNIYFYILILIQLSSCDNRINEDQYITALERKLPINSKKKFVVREIYDFQESGNNYSEIRLEYISSDTTEYIDFNYYGGDSIIVNSYDKTIINDSLKYVLNMTSDTCYYYILDRKDSVANFLVGEYCYNFQKLLLSPSQTSYYIKNVDSLYKIRGNGLPALPEIR